MTLERYMVMRQAVWAAGFREEYEWANNIKPPETAVELFCEYSWVVINAGMKEQIARKIWKKVKDAIINGWEMSSVFGHEGKVKAIEEGWRHQQKRFELFKQAEMSGTILEFCESLPYIGKITKYHLAKNLGAQVAKPDRWLERVAKQSGETVQDLCERLAKESGDRITAVDNTIWRMCNLGLW